MKRSYDHKLESSSRDGNNDEEEEDLRIQPLIWIDDEETRPPFSSKRSRMDSTVKEQTEERIGKSRTLITRYNSFLQDQVKEELMLNKKGYLEYAAHLREQIKCAVACSYGEETYYLHFPMDNFKKYRSFIYCVLVSEGFYKSETKDHVMTDNNHKRHTCISMAFRVTDRSDRTLKRPDYVHAALQAAQDSMSLRRAENKDEFFIQMTVRGCEYALRHKMGVMIHPTLFMAKRLDFVRDEIAYRYHYIIDRHSKDGTNTFGVKMDDALFNECQRRVFAEWLKEPVAVAEELPDHEHEPEEGECHALVSQLTRQQQQQSIQVNPECEDSDSDVDSCQ